MRIYYHKDLYSKVALLKAAYHFTDNYYVYLGIEGDCYFVDFNSKSESYILASRINCFLTAHRTVHSCRKKVFAYGMTLFNNQHSDIFSKNGRNQ